MMVIGKLGCAMLARQSSLGDEECPSDGNVSSKDDRFLAADDLAGWTARPAMHGKREGPGWPSTAMIEGI